MEHLQALQKAFEEKSIQDALRYASVLLGGELKFSTSFGQEDQVLTDIIVRHSVPVTLFTIDTGRMFNEVYETMEKTVARYKRSIDVFFPQTEPVEQMIKEHGINLFYDSVEKRQSCCNVRKVEPLQRALKGATAWITGLRSAQTDHRKNIPVVEWLAEKNLYKINPLLHWSFDEVLDYLKKYSVPYNSLHDKGFVSIGCAPCTRAIVPGEDPRAGRWWWEVSQKECGLHVVK